MADAQTVTVSILDKDYQVNCRPEEVDELKRSANYLDMKMREIKTGSQVLGLDRIAVMAALNIANDFLGETQKTTDVIEHQATEILNLSDKLDRALGRLKT